MQGTILIADGVATNRIMLKVQLSAAYYHVVQTDRMVGMVQMIRRVRPDLIMTAMSLPDGTAMDLCRALQTDDSLAAIPVIAIAAQNDRAARMSALAAGVTDVLSHPVDDLVLQARIRSLVRARNTAEELHPGGGGPRSIGMAEPAPTFDTAPLPATEVAILTRAATDGALWKSRLAAHVDHRLKACRPDDMHALIDAGQVPDGIILGIGRAPGDPDLRLLADLRAGSTTRHAAILAVPDASDRHLAAKALDLGADDVILGGFNAPELALRLQAQLQRKRRADQLRDTVRDDLQAAFVDPMTGLYNRRHALPHLARVARQAEQTGRNFAVMLADLDHFKAINDRFGHPAGDAVLTETAARLRGMLRPSDMLARVGGEEFMIVMPDADLVAATASAQRMCRVIESHPFDVARPGGPVRVTISIGVVVGPVPGRNRTGPPCADAASALIGQADKALYSAKDAGRNQVTLIESAA